jgi:hypothetical protein
VLSVLFYLSLCARCTVLSITLCSLYSSIYHFVLAVLFHISLCALCTVLSITLGRFAVLFYLSLCARCTVLSIILSQFAVLFYRSFSQGVSDKNLLIFGPPPILFEEASASIYKAIFLLTPTKRSADAKKGVKTNSLFFKIYFVLVIHP